MTLQLDRKPRLATYMATFGITARALADAVGVSETHISYIKTGRRQPSRVVRQAIAREFGFPEADIFPDS